MEIRMDGNLAEAQTAYLVDTPKRPRKLRTERIGVVGLGYVGLPVAVSLADAYEKVVGFDINRARVEALSNARDWTREIDTATLALSSLVVSAKPADLASCTLYIVAVPTPVDGGNRPDLLPLKAACRTLGPLLNSGDLVVFESTVYPGATEEVCLPELERHSGLKGGRDFHVAYSPERISPGDRAHGLQDVPKIISADTPGALERLAEVYGRIIPAGIHRAPSIRVAEAAKVFENTQRDVNIALMNEFSQICDKLGIRSRDVIKATATKWNALPFTPGLVGGHCIGVDPHYLIHKAEENGLHPEIMLASRRSNEAVAPRIARKAATTLARRGLPPGLARVAVFGLTFKEDVPDMRNSKAVDLVRELQGFGLDPLLCDPQADPAALSAMNLTTIAPAKAKILDMLILAVPHAGFRDISMLQDALKPGGTLIDVRAVLEPSMLRPDLSYWSL